MNNRSSIKNYNNDNSNSNSNDNGLQDWQVPVHSSSPREDAAAEIREATNRDELDAQLSKAPSGKMGPGPGRFQRLVLDEAQATSINRSLEGALQKPVS